MVIIVPNPLQNLQPNSFDIGDAIAAENRVHEIAFVSMSTAPELMSVFVKACFSLATVYAKLQKEHRFAEKKLAERKAEVMLDIVPIKLAEKKASANEQNREAVVESDHEYNRMAYAEIEIEAALMLVREKLRSMEGALGAVKKIVSDTVMTNWRPNPNLVVPPDRAATAESLTGSTTLVGPGLTTIGYWAPETATLPPPPPTVTTTASGLRIGKGKY
jgi:hypothetical protein